MRVRNRDVADVWGTYRMGEGARNYDGSLRVMEDGRVYSYELLIGEIVDGEHIVYDHTAPGGSYYSQTTSKHVNLIKPYGKKIISYR